MKNLILFVASLFFYAWGEPVYIFIMLFSTVFDYYNGIMLEKTTSDFKRKLILILSVVINLLILGFFKYSDMVIDTINMMFNLNINNLNLPLPIGISFYTFQTMSYTIDVYRNNAKAQHNIISFGAYVTMFPQLVAGPIVRYNTIAYELDNRVESYDKFYIGIRRFVCGLSKKVLLANNIGYLWDSIKILPQSEMSVLLSWLGIIAFAFQIYFDFSGYSDMAIGLGKMMGFDFDENFNYPYISKSVSEFFRRWHISLGTWFKEYLYIPIGGNRKGMLRTVLNLFIVWFLTGLWHGASYNFIAWGIYYGIIISLEKLFLSKILHKIPGFLCHIYTLFTVLIGWVIFAFDKFSEGINYIKYMFGINVAFVNREFLYNFNSSFLFLIILVIASTPLIKKIKMNKYVTMVLIVSGFIISTAYLVNSGYNPFLYFRF